MKKIKIEKVIFGKSSHKRLQWKDIKHVDFQDDDIFDVYEDDQDPDDYPTIFFKIKRLFEETDEECELRYRQLEEFKESSKKRRYEHYLELKKEFENGQESN